MIRSPSSLLVTGGAGFLGSAFIRHLLGREDFAGRLVNLDALTYAANLDNLAPVSADPRYRFVRGDVRDRQLVGDLCQQEAIEAIVHFAAETHVDRSIHGPSAFVETNVVGTATLLEVARSLDLHLHHVSTDEVYGSLAEDEIATEEQPYRPSSPYAASKAAADHLVQAYARTYGTSTSQSNACNGYGPHQHPEKLLPLMILALKAGETLPIYGDGQQQRCWIHADDHAEAVWTILTSAPAGQRYNVSGSPAIANRALVERLVELFADQRGVDPAPLRALMRQVADRPGHDRRYAPDASKLERELGYRPRRGLDQGLPETVRFYLESEEWLARAVSGEHRAWLKQNYDDRG